MNIIMFSFYYINKTFNIYLSFKNNIKLIKTTRKFLIFEKLSGNKIYNLISKQI
ncbi:hypothetical protein CLOSBL3_12728 [Clostridiaceae bacterium BL-3]|nr:hypothetical protein CLOSBL3_12728 [Clostridiaceae bacterium BL-3]